MLVLPVLKMFGRKPCFAGVQCGAVRPGFNLEKKVRTHCWYRTIYLQSRKMIENLLIVV